MSVQLPNGAWVTQITPFKQATNEIDWETLDHLIEWEIESKIAGIFTVCQSSEMYVLADAERIALAKHVVQKVNKRVPVVAVGNFGDTIADQADSIKRIYATGVQCVVINVSTVCAQEQGNDVWQNNVKQLMELTGNIPLGVYECPKPYHRLLDDKLLGFLIESNRFFFHKDTCCSFVALEAKLKVVNALHAQHPNFKFYNANVATLSWSLFKGAHGFSGICANFYPDLIVKLVQKSLQHKENNADIQLLQSQLTVFESTVATKYPASAKLYLQLSEPRFKSIETHCRIMNDKVFNEEETCRLKDLYNCVNFARKQQ